MNLKVATAESFSIPSSPFTSGIRLSFASRAWRCGDVGSIFLGRTSHNTSVFRGLTTLRREDPDRSLSFAERAFGGHLTVQHSTARDHDGKKTSRIPHAACQRRNKRIENDETTPVHSIFEGLHRFLPPRCHPLAFQTCLHLHLHCIDRLTTFLFSSLHFSLTHTYSVSHVRLVFLSTHNI